MNSTPRPTACPDETILAASLEDRLTPQEADQVRRHLAQCGRCRALMADVLLALEDPDEITVPEFPPADVHARALAAVRDRGAAGRWFDAVPRRIAMGLAAAIAILLGVKFFQRPIRIGSENENIKRNVPEMRGEEQESFRSLSPKDQAVLANASPATLVLEWSEYRVAGNAVPHSSSDVVNYVVTVLDATGHLAWSAKTSDTRIVLPPTAPIVPGTTYTWSVVAQPEFGRGAATRPATFTVSR